MDLAASDVVRDSEHGQGFRLVLSLTAYFDESGTHDGSNAVAVAGYLSTAENWQRFESEWGQALSDFGVDFFRMNKFANHAPPFGDWPERKRHARLGRLLTIINRNVLGSAGLVIPRPLYDAVMSDKAKSVCGSPYGLAALCCFTEVAGLLRALNRHDAWVAYVFESGALGQGEIQKMFARNERSPSDKEHFRLLSLRFESKRQFAPLQAADLLAYELYQQGQRQLGMSSRTPRAYILSRLSEVPSHWWYYNEAELRKAADLLSVVADYRARRGRDSPAVET